MHGKLDLNLFVVLHAVYDQGGITKAANALCPTIQ
jgi:DNA-binding transcriptional LysR family regulator